MANHASAEKRNRQRLKRTARNRAGKSTLRSAVKQARTAINAKSEGVANTVREAWSELDRAAKKGIVPVERANRLKSRLALALRKTTAPAPTSA